MRGSTASSGTTPTVRLLRAPSADPPYDDEPTADVPDPDVAHLIAAASAWHRRDLEPGGTSVTPPRGATIPAPALPDAPSPAPPPPAHSAGAPPAAAAPAGSGVPAAHRFTQLCVEVIGGFRPVHHLRALTSPAAFDMVATQLARPGTSSRRSPRQATHGVSRPPARAPERVRLRRVRACPALQNAVEAAAVLTRGDQTWALAIRLERRDQAWLCTHLQVV